VFYQKVEHKIAELLAPIDPKAIQVDELLSLINKYPLNIKIFINEARRNKILPQVFFNVQYLQQKFNIKIFFLTECEKEIRRISPTVRDREKNISILQKTINNILQIEKNVVFLKGATLQNLYLIYTGTFREMVDVDILFLEADSFFNFLILMSNKGYSINGNKISIGPVVFSKSGVAKITTYSLNLLHSHLYPRGNCKKIIDVKFGNHFFLPTRLLFEKRIKSKINELEFWATSLEHTFYILVNHLLEHGSIKLYWINDLYLLSTKTSLNWDYLLALFSQKGLMPLFCSLLEYTEKIFKKTYIIDSLIQNYPKYFTKYKKSRAFRFLLKQEHDWKLSPFEIFFIEVEKRKNRVRYRVTFCVIFCFLLLKMIRSYMPRWLKNIQKKLKNFIIIPLKIKYGYPVKLPIIYIYNIKVPKKSLLLNENIEITVTWSRKSGFRLSYPLIDIEVLDK